MQNFARWHGVKSSNVIPHSMSSTTPSRESEVVEIYAASLFGHLSRVNTGPIANIDVLEEGKSVGCRARALPSFDALL